MNHCCVSLEPLSQSALILENCRKIPRVPSVWTQTRPGTWMNQTQTVPRPITGHIIHVFSIISVWKRLQRDTTVLLWLWLELYLFVKLSIDYIVSIITLVYWTIVLNALIIIFPYYFIFRSFHTSGNHSCCFFFLFREKYVSSHLTMVESLWMWVGEG